MKRVRRRYVLLSFSSSAISAQKASELVYGLLGSRGIRTMEIHAGPGILIYRCSNRDLGDLRGLFPLTLSGDESIRIERVSGTLKGLSKAPKS